MILEPYLEGSNQPVPPVEEAGGKGHGLYWLAANGFPVPPTWVLTTAAFDLVVERSDLGHTLVEMGHALAAIGDDWAAIQRGLDALEPKRRHMANGLREARLPDRLGAGVEKLALMPTLWAVRSSATLEDDPQHTFAGQFLSLLSVPGGKALWGAIRQVWASLFEREPLAYCVQNRLPLPKMAVILQPMAPLTFRDRSGVVFSHSPVPALPGALIQVAFGSGQTVVNGYGGDLYSVDRDVRIQRMPPDEIRVSGEEGGMIAMPSPADPPLSDDEARELAVLALAVAERWGRPVNLEFTWRAGERPVIVQVRSAR